jgi:molecular chaperone DnaJ
MAAKHDYYETLNVPRGADADEVRKSYRKLARKYHPDLNPGDKAAEERFKMVQEAYDVLSDQKKRQMYDQYGFYSENGYPGSGAAGPQPGMDFGGFDFTDFFSGAGGHRQQTSEGFGGNLKDMFSQFFRRGSPDQAAPPEKGADLEYGLNIDFWQAIKGTQARLNITRYEVCDTCHGSGLAGGSTTTCPQCNGTGQVGQMAGAMKFNLSCPRCGGSGKLKNACPSCQGEGRVPKTETVEVRIPPGARTGSRWEQTRVTIRAGL